MMLSELHIHNFAIIDQLHLTFTQGLNILTGETGAGKSIIIDALGMLLGDRAGASWIRAGSSGASIEATFQLLDDQTESTTQSIQSEVSATIRQLLADQDLDDPENPEWVSVSREIRQNGRNVCRINGQTVRLQVLRELTSNLIDVHGQGEHLNLLRPKTHIHLLDRYAGLRPMREAVAVQVRELRHIRAELKRLKQDERAIAQKIDMLSFQVEEIMGAALEPGEEAELESERRRLSNAEALKKLAQAVQGILNEGDGELPSALDLVSQAVGRLERLANIDPDMDQSAKDGQSLLEELSELANTMQDYADQLLFDPIRLQEVEERLILIGNLKRKYGDTIAQIIAFGTQAQAELDALSNWEVKTEKLEQQEERLLHTIGDLGVILSQERQAAGERLARQVERELADLHMNRARYGVDVQQSVRKDGAYLPDGRRVTFDETGVDQVEFMLSANPGEPLKPMAQVASGGETARLMLALKGVLAHADATPTLIFDEIDQGIGGRVGAIVGQKLWNLTGQQRVHAQNGTEAPQQPVPHQVLCITHLPQLAAFGDQHFTVNKRVFSENGEERTSTLVRNLGGNERTEELMQMLGAVSAAGRRSVEEMMEEVERTKQGL